jgi:hypothetical protein
VHATYPCARFANNSSCSARASDRMPHVAYAAAWLTSG